MKKTSEFKCTGPDCPACRIIAHQTVQTLLFVRALVGRTPNVALAGSMSVRWSAR